MRKSKTLKTGYVAYNKLYEDGKPTGRRYRASKVYATASAAKAAAFRYNRDWNKTQSERGKYASKVVEVKKVGQKRKPKKKSRGMFDFDIGFRGF